MFIYRNSFNIADNGRGTWISTATSPDPLAYAREAGRQSVRLAKMKNMKPSDIVTMDIMVLMKTILKIRRKDTQH